MILSLFRNTTANPAAALYAATVAAARQPGWYTAAGVPDTIDGRYCVLATLLAIADLRLADGGPAAMDLAPRLTEMFVDDMDSQLRQDGLGDPTLGKQVRGLVAGLSGRIDRWRRLFSDPDGDWAPVLRSSLYRDAEPDHAQKNAARAMIDDWRERLQRTSDEALAEGVSQ